MTNSVKMTAAAGLLTLAAAFPAAAQEVDGSSCAELAGTMAQNYADFTQPLNPGIASLRLEDLSLLGDEMPDAVPENPAERWRLYTEEMDAEWQAFFGCGTEPDTDLLGLAELAKQGDEQALSTLRNTLIQSDFKNSERGAERFAEEMISELKAQGMDLSGDFENALGEAVAKHYQALERIAFDIDLRTGFELDIRQSFMELVMLMQQVMQEAQQIADDKKEVKAPVPAPVYG